ncbi:hypothetical protein BH23GEM7_BH23GEM7_39330 [soil metagenome]
MPEPSLAASFDLMHPLESYLREIRDIRYSGAAVQETSYYGPLATLLNEVGRALRPRVQCFINLQNRGAGIPDGGFFTADQLPRGAEGEALPGQLPARGALEVKGTSADAWKVAESEQVAKYLAKYGQVQVTNLRDWVLIGHDHAGRRRILESYRLTASEAAFWEAAKEPARFAREQGDGLFEYLKRVLLRPAPLADPKEVAWFLASYAREARQRSEEAGALPLRALRQSLEAALGIRFEGTRGEHFFRSTLVQTLFYGVFSAWVLWHKQNGNGRFEWRMSEWSLHVPMIRALFHQIAEPERLHRLDLVEVLDWTAEALNRVDRAAFFARFEEEHAVQYFYEPFLEAFDPALRKELGVWYTPPEVVRYMVARVDTVLREELGIADGLADSRVVVLDPCCGTGAYLVEVLRRIRETLARRGDDALLGSDLKRAAIERVFGFEILPAPFVVSHLQLGLLLQEADAPLAGKERAGVYLTNALTGWVPPKDPKDQLPIAFPELETERDAAAKVKQRETVLVVIGNPPYNGYSGVAMGEERDLVNAYRRTTRAPAPQGQGLNDLYVRFFRMAERKIVEMTGRGVVCFISNYSWLDGLSFTGMRERYLEVFDRIWIDSLNGDKYRTGKLTPEGAPDPSIFSTEYNREGIQVGTAIATLVRTAPHGETDSIRFRNLWGKGKWQELEETAEQDGVSLYEEITPDVGLGYPFMPRAVAADYLSWPTLPELFPIYSPGVKTSRDIDLVSIDLEPLQQRLAAFVDPTRSDDQVRAVASSLMSRSARYDPSLTRQRLQSFGISSGYFTRFAYRPFDTRYVYWHREGKLLDEKREELFGWVRTGNLFLTSRQKAERTREGTPFYITPHLPDWHLTRPGSICFPLLVTDSKNQQHGLFDSSAPEERQPRANLSETAREYLRSLGIPDPAATRQTQELLWLHAVAIGHSPRYLQENAGALEQDWPRVPLPQTREALLASAELGRRLAALLNPELPVPGVTGGEVRPELRVVGVVSRVGGGSLHPEAGDLDVTARWGIAGRGGITMPGRGRVAERPYTAEERAAIAAGAAALGLDPDAAFRHLGESCFDVYLNERAYWRCVPARVWAYTLGGYQVIKKWLSYREKPLLGRALKPEEAREVRDIARRIAAILLLEPALDAGYGGVKGEGMVAPAPEGR